MSKFFFHIQQAEAVYKDRRGGEFVDLRAAWVWALHDARYMMEHGEVSQPPERCWVEICDSAGVPVASMPFARVAALN